MSGIRPSQPSADPWRGRAWAYVVLFARVYLALPLIVLGAMKAVFGPRPPAELESLFGTSSVGVSALGVAWSVLPFAEVAVGLLILFRVDRSFVLRAAAGLLIAFSLWTVAVIALTTGDLIDCGCLPGGESIAQSPLAACLRLSGLWCAWAVLFQGRRRSRLPKPGGQ